MKDFVNLDFNRVVRKYRLDRIKLTFLFLFQMMKSITSKQKSFWMNHQRVDSNSFFGIDY